MIRFFRKIRQQLLTENKFSKYLLYALGEIVLVVIGILIALQVNILNDSKKQHRAMVNNLRYISFELDNEITIMETDFELFGYYAQYFNSILTKSYSQIDPKMFLTNLTRNIPIREFGAAYFSAMSNGTLTGAPDSLSNQLLKYYQVYYKQYYNSSEYHRSFVSQTIEDYIIRNYDFNKEYSLDSASAMHIIESGNLNSFINYQEGIFEDFIVRYNRNIDEAKEISQAIKAFLKENDD